MEADLAISILVILALAALASVIGYRFGLRLSPLLRISLFAASMLAATIHAAIVSGRLELAGLFRLSSAICFTNITPVLICFSVGLAWTIPGPDAFVRHVRLSLMAALSVLFFFAPLLRPAIRPVISDEATRFDKGVCLQSHPASCAAAAAATLLSAHGISVSESQMMHACLTSRDGTEPLGLYRGLVLRTQSRRLSPRLASHDAAQWDQLCQYPLVALVTFRNDENSAPPTLRRILGRDAEGHAIVVFGRTPGGKFIVGDPAVGRTLWDQEVFERRFSGQAIYLSC